MEKMSLPVSPPLTFLHVTQTSLNVSQMGLSNSPRTTGPRNQPQTWRGLRSKIPCKSPFNIPPCYATDGDAPDTIELIRQVSTNQNAVMAFYYTDASNQVWMVILSPPIRAIYDFLLNGYIQYLGWKFIPNQPIKTRITKIILKNVFLSRWKLRRYLMWRRLTPRYS